MPKMIALRKFRYPSGPNAQEHLPGAEVDVLTDRDAKALRLIKAARDVPLKEAPDAEPAEKKAKGTRTLKPEPALAPRPQSRPVEPMTTTSMSAEPGPSEAGPVSRPGTYKREDLTAEQPKTTTEQPKTTEESKD
jgi:hypothetical protein